MPDLKTDFIFGLAGGCSSSSRFGIGEVEDHRHDRVCLEISVKRDDI